MTNSKAKRTHAEDAAEVARVNAELRGRLGELGVKIGFEPDPIRPDGDPYGHADKVTQRMVLAALKSEAVLKGRKLPSLDSLIDTDNMPGVRAECLVTRTALDAALAEAGPTMVPPIANHSPNIEGGRQVVVVTLKQWRYEKSFTVKVGGNCRGFEIFESAVDQVLATLDEDAPKVVLTDPSGEDCEVCFDASDDGDEESWLQRMVVGIRIVGWDPPTLNEVRASNGAAPLPDGDKPWDPDGTFLKDTVLAS